MSYYGNYYKYMHDLGYYSLACPILQSPVNAIKRNRIQTILCAIVQIFVLYETVVGIYTTSRQELGSNVFRLVATTEQCTYPFFQFFFMYTSWFKTRKLGVFFDEFAEIQFPASKEGRARQMRKIRLLSGLVVFLCVFGFFSQELLRFAKSNCDLMTYMNYCAKEAEQAYFPDATGALWSAQTLFHFLLRFPTYLTTYVSWSIMLLGPLAMRHCLVDFLSMCKGKDSVVNGGGEAPIVVEYSQILWYYAKIKKLFKIMNEGFGFLFLAIVVLTISYYPIWAGSFFFVDDGRRPVKSAAAWCLFIWRSISLWSILTLCAEVNAKAGDFYDWVSTRTCEDSVLGSPEKVFSPPSLNPSASVMTALTMDMNSCQIALKGGSMFSMTYGFLGSVVGVTLTYTIVIVQLHLQTR